MGKKQFQIPESELRSKAEQEGITKLVVGIAIVKDGRILIVRRVPDDYLGGNYELPGGGVDEGESIEDSIKREALEETGLKVLTILSMHQGFDYETPSNKVRQFNFLVDVLEGEVKLEPSEHDSFEWISKTDLGKYPMTNKMKNSIKQLLEDL